MYGVVVMARVRTIAFVFLMSLALSIPAYAQVKIPNNAERFKRDLIRASHYYWGLDAPVATFAAQIHAESYWRTQVKSHAGAEGLAQFMPATADWISGLYKDLKSNDPYNPDWAIRAMLQYDDFLYKRVKAIDQCNRMGKALAAYNGGLGWVQRDERLASKSGLNSQILFGHVDSVNAGRSASNKRENRNYPRKILLQFQPAYEDAGWGPGVDCDAY